MSADLGLSERRAPTHILRIDVPLSLSDDELPYDYDPVADAMKLALAISRAGFAGHICDDPQVTMIESPSRGQNETTGCATVPAHPEERPPAAGLP